MSASYAILNSTEQADGSILYEVILKAEDGYQETQKYVGDSSQSVLVAAAQHMNDEHMAQVAAIPPKDAVPEEPVFVPV